MLTLVDGLVEVVLWDGVGETPDLGGGVKNKMVYLVNNISMLSCLCSDLDHC